MPSPRDDSSSSKPPRRDDISSSKPRRREDSVSPRPERRPKPAPPKPEPDAPSSSNAPLIAAIIGAVATLVAAVVGLLPLFLGGDKGNTPNPAPVVPVVQNGNPNIPTTPQGTKPTDQTGNPSVPSIKPTVYDTGNLPKDIENSLGMKLKLIPPGKFTMGSQAPERIPYRPKGPGHNFGEDPTREVEHEVEITKPFYMGAVEVKQLEYEKVMRYNPSYYCNDRKYKESTPHNTSNFPVERVGWAYANEFCVKLSQLPQERAAGRVYRLPTEAEWEYACRGGASEYTVFHLGNTLTSKQANISPHEPYGVAVKGIRLESSSSADVGSFKANNFGLHDMHGSVAEWCSDWYDRLYYLSSPKQDPQGPAQGTAHVIRGGAFDSPGILCRSGSRAYLLDEALLSREVGLRVVCVVGAEAAPTLQKMEATVAAALASIGEPVPVVAEPSEEVNRNYPLVVNSLGMKLRQLPAGKFVMGSPDTEKDFQDGTFRDKRYPETQHEVELTKPFCMGVFEVTQEEYEKVMGANPSYNNSKLNGHGSYILPDTKRFPVDNVSWEEAAAFCEKLSQRPEERAAGRVYRLPTEAEWEYGCRGGAKTYSIFHYGDTLSAAQANVGGRWPYGRDIKQGNGLNRSTHVGSYKPNGFGLYDMHGNVSEWCEDWFEIDYYKNSPQQDPKGPASGKNRVSRGGASGGLASWARSAHRSHSISGSSGSRNSGFRVVCSVGMGK